MKNCSALVLLLGENTHYGTWVLHEINVALSRKIPAFAMRIPNTRECLALILKKKRITIVEWNPLQIKIEIDSLYGRN